MQLNKKNISTALLGASCALMSSASNSRDWEYEAAVMSYAETDRVTAIEAVLVASTELANEKTFSGKIVVDVLTGASASGAVPQNSPQTFTRPSGNGSYTVNPGELPLDDTFQDTRVQLNGQLSQKLHDATLSYGINLSREYDYQSIAINGSYAKDLNNKNTTLSIGASLAFDTIDAVGDQPVPLSEMAINNGQDTFQEEFDLTRQSNESTNRDTVDLIFGLTQVINRRWLTQFNLGLSSVSGYLTDPYKVLSEVDSTGTTQAIRFERRPDKRNKSIIFAQSKYHFEKNIWDISYRFSNDDWGINSHTIETRYLIPLGERHSITPHLRIYQQSEADFYTPFLLSGQLLPEFASADYRIGKLDTLTMGIKYNQKMRNNKEWGVRLEYYKQTPKNNGVELVGQLADLELFPSLDALVLQFNYKF